MNYFEVKDRLACLEEFRRLYAEYLEFTNRESNVPALMVRKKLEPLTALTVDSLRQVGLGSMITREAPSKGGRKIRINLIKAIFRDHVRRHFSLDDRKPLELLDKGILEYKRLYWRQMLQLYNPFFWLYHFIAYAVKLPLILLDKANLHVDKVETLPPFKLYLIVGQLLLYFLLIKYTGVLAFIKINIFGN